MKHLIARLSVALFGFALVLNSCTEDLGGDEIDIIDTPPAVALLNEVGFLANDATLSVGDTFRVKLETVPGTQPLEVLTIFENGTQLATSRLRIEGITANNPLLIVGDAKQGTTYDITILPDQNVTMPDVLTYAFEVTDEVNQQMVTALTITTEVPFTALDETITGALFSQAGPAGTGGLDLDTGKSVGSRDTLAEIQDEGINLDLPASQNWRQQISAVNDSEVRVVDFASFGDGQLSFDAIQFKEQVAEAFATGKALDGEDLSTNSNGSTIATDTSDEDFGEEEVSLPVIVGDVFAVRRGDRTYLIECTAVNVTTEQDNNNDSYEFSIKY